jgi:hypothetical protein
MHKLFVFKNPECHISTDQNRDILMFWLSTVKIVILVKLIRFFKATSNAELFLNEISKIPSFNKILFVNNLP